MISVEFVTSQITQPTTSCEPFFSGAGPQEVLAATLNPFNPCPSNCSAEQAARFVRFYYYDRLADCLRIAANNGKYHTN